MISELIVTSAPRGLQAGRSGFTTVCRTRGIHPDLASRLEAASGYRHVFPQGDPRNPVVFSYTSKPSSLGEVWVMSRVGDAGTDYTGRSNKIAHHIALQQSDLPPLANSNPAAVMAALAASGGLLAKWQGDPRENTAPPQLSAPPTNPSPCQRWASITGDPGWAGILAERALNKEATWIIAPAGTDLLALFSEALALISPNQRWQVPFTTYSLRGDEGRWLGTVAGSPEAEAAAAQKRIQVIDLTRRSMAPSGGAYVAAARGQANAPWHREKTAAPVRAGTTSTRLQRQVSGSMAGLPDSGRMQPGLPPVLTRPLDSLHGQPPDLTEWEDVELAKPRTGRLMLFATLGLVVLVFGSLLVGYGAYRLNWLPDSVKTSLELAAWRYGVPFIAPQRPQEVTDALAWQKQLQESYDALIKQIPREEIEGHPALKTLLYNDVPTTLSSLAKKTDDEAARSAPPEELKALAQDAAKAKAFVEVLTPFRESEGLRKAHKNAAATLRNTKRSTQRNGDSDTEQVPSASDEAKKAREGLVAAAKNLQVSSVEQIAKAIKDLTNSSENNSASSDSSNVDNSQDPNPDSGQPPPHTPIIELLAKAIDDQHHLPLQGLNERERSQPFALVKWEGDANPESLDSVSLLLPEVSDSPNVSCELRKTQKQSKETRQWECHIKGDPNKNIGTFELSGKELTFKFDSAKSLIRQSLLPFLPLVITSTDSGKEIPATWVQLLSPRAADGPLVAGKQENKFLIYENTIASAGEVLQAVFSGTPSRLIWRNGAVRARSDGVRLHLSRAGEFAFKEELMVTPKRESLWWQPAVFAEAPSSLNAFQEPVDLSVRIDVANAAVSVSASADFSYDNAVGRAAKSSPSPRTRSLLVEKARNGAKTIVPASWDHIVIDITGWGLTLPQEAWNSLPPNDKKESLRKVHSESKGKKDQSLKEWISDLQRECEREEGFADHVTAEAAATKQLREHPFHKLGGLPGRKENEDDKTYQRRLAELKEEHKKQKASYDALLEKATADLTSDTRELVKWAAILQANKSTPPSGEDVRLFLWMSLYKYQVALEHSFVSDDILRNETNDPRLSDFANVCEGSFLLISGDLELDWTRDCLQFHFAEKDTPRIRLVNFPRPTAETTPQPAIASEKTGAEIDANAGDSFSTGKKGP